MLIILIIGCSTDNPEEKINTLQNQIDTLSEENYQLENQIKNLNNDKTELESDINRLNEKISEDKPETTNPPTNGETEIKVLTMEDYSCNLDTDCVLKSYPGCSGESIMIIDTCINKDVEIPPYINCEGNMQTPTIGQIINCKCVENPSGEYPEKYCKGT